MGILYPSTIRFLWQCVNIVARAIIVSVAWAALMGVGVFLNLLLKYVAGVYGVPEDIQTKMAQLALSFPIVLAVVVTIAGVVDALKIAFASFQSSSESDTLNNDEDTAK